MSQMLKLPALNVGTPVAVVIGSPDSTVDPFQLQAAMTNLVSYVDDLVFYNDEIVEYF